MPTSQGLLQELEHPAVTLQRTLYPKEMVKD